MGEKFNLTWHTFSSHGQDLFKNLMETQEFTDVTLISDDQHQYRVHKFILSACSTVFRKILTSNPHNSSIYLRGIDHEELESVLQFIYLGEASFYHERMNEFLNVAKNLDIKEIGKNVIDADEESQNEDDNESFVHQENPVTSKESHGNVVDMSFRTSQDNNYDSSNSLLLDNKKPYKCPQCENQFTKKFSLERHIEAKHEDAKYLCQQCDYKTTTQIYLKNHIESKHEGIKYPCQQCDYQATQPSALQRHVKSKHDGAKYPCQQCDYQASFSTSLYRHVKTIHDSQ